MGRNRNYPEWFEQWQDKFYHSKEWKALRNEVRNEMGMRCELCHKLIRGRSICDHIEEITPRNYQDVGITLGRKNIQLLCIECHNNKTFSEVMKFEPDNDRNVNLM